MVDAKKTALKRTAEEAYVRAHVRATEQVDASRDCATGCLADMDEREHLMIGMLVAMAIHNIWQSREDGTQRTRDYFALY